MHCCSLLFTTLAYKTIVGADLVSLFIGDERTCFEMVARYPTDRSGRQQSIPKPHYVS